MLSTIYFLRYNNYYNRKLKRELTLSDYEDYIIGTQERHNFISNDGVSTEMVMNTYTGEIPDYLLVVENNEIMSRWFVIDATRNCKGQFTMNLFRDTLADYFDDILNAPIFVEKAMLDASNPLIFNQEDMTFNQIRKPPKLLNDITECPWIVGYIPSDSDLENKTINATYNTANSPDIQVENISDWTFAKYLETPGYYNYRQYTGYRYSEEIQKSDYAYQKECANKFIGVSNNSVDRRTDNDWYGNNNNGKLPSQGYYDNNSDYQGTYYYTVGRSNPQWEAYINKVRTDTQYTSYINSYFESKYDLINEVEYAELSSLNGKTILDISSNSLYKISFIIEAFSEETSLINEQAIISKLKSFVPKQGIDSNIIHGNVVNKTFTAVLEGYACYISLEQTQTSISVPLSNNRYHLEDQPYDMFCIPYGRVSLLELDKGFKSQLIGTSLASNIAKELGSDVIYDVQILPYCPVKYAWNDEYNCIDLTKTKYSIIKDQDGKAVSALIWCRQSNFSFNIDLNLPDIKYPIEKKIKSQTEVYRLVSPNYGSIFEFNPYKNGGVSSLRIDCSYRPFNPFIRLAPVFNNLYGYGGQYDSRGLILNGDFSITQLSNAWANYELQNKNYQAIFDRQIKNMEVQNKYQRINDYFTAITGTFSGAVGGAMTGGMMSGMHPAGFAVGAGVGGTLSAAGGIADIVINEKLREEAIDFTRDQFGYNLGNIQAIPTALAKTSVLSINNPLIPMLEMYDCTVEEKNAFRNKIEYNGMTVMAIGTMSNYIDNGGYFKGKLIRLEGIEDDFHIINTIAKELDKGVFLS